MPENPEPKNTVDSAQPHDHGASSAGARPEVTPLTSPEPPFEARPSFVRAHAWVLVACIVVVCVGALAAFAYQSGWLRMPLFGAPYEEATFMTDLMHSLQEIDSARHTLGIALFMEEREADAYPFNVDMEGREEHRVMYERDVERVQYIEEVTWELDSRTTFGASLAGMGIPPANDPQTSEPYTYRAINGGQDYELVFTLETADALGFVEGTEGTTVDGMTVTVNRSDGWRFFYLPAEPPPTMFESLGTFAQFMPPELDIRGAITIAAESEEADTSANWDLNIVGEGDLGDLIYHVNVDMRHVDEKHYIRVNNMPGLFAAYLPPKGQWVEWDVTDNMYMMIDEGDIEESKQQLATLYEQLHTIARIADETGLIRFKNPPVREVRSDVSSYRYDLGARKDAIVPFYERVLAEVEQNETLSELLPLFDEAFLEYLKSDAFDEAFAYYDQNTSFTVWMDGRGMPIDMEYNVRIVPPEDTIAIAGKQLILSLTMALDDINERIEITVPEDAKTIEEAYEGYVNPFEEARLQGERAALKANLNNIRAQAELVYDDEGGYGTVAFPNGTCEERANTLFSNELIFDAITYAAEEDLTRSTCVSTSAGGVVQHYAVAVEFQDAEGTYYCIDSTGYANETDVPLTGDSCE